jgi:beta-glucosidase
VQLYLNRTDAKEADPIRSLAGFQRIALRPGEHKVARFKLLPRQFAKPGAFQVVLGGKQPGFKGAADANTTAVISGIVRLEGPTQPVN